jgi:predicted peptidase
MHYSIWGTLVCTGFLTKSVNLGNDKANYVVYIPTMYDPNTPMPMIVFLNGQGECGSDGLKQISVGLGTAVMNDLTRWPFIIAFPQKQVEKALWETEDAMVMAIVDEVRRDYNIDGSRIYLTGLSQGGHGTWAIAALHPELFAAIVPICGWGDEEIAAKLVGMPVWTFHGDQDNAVSVECAYEMERYLREAGGSCRLTIYEGIGHNSWDRAYREEPVPEWLLEHSR